MNGIPLKMISFFLCICQMFSGYAKFWIKPLLDPSLTSTLQKMAFRLEWDNGHDVLHTTDSFRTFLCNSSSKTVSIFTDFAKHQPYTFPLTMSLPVSRAHSSLHAYNWTN